jgi:hypothetical protein
MLCSQGHNIACVNATECDWHTTKQGEVRRCIRIPVLVSWCTKGPLPAAWCASHTQCIAHTFLCLWPQQVRRQRPLCCGICRGCTVNTSQQPSAGCPPPPPPLANLTALQPAHRLGRITPLMHVPRRWRVSPCSTSRLVNAGRFASPERDDSCCESSPASSPSAPMLLHTASAVAWLSPVTTTTRMPAYRHNTPTVAVL